MASKKVLKSEDKTEQKRQAKEVADAAQSKKKLQALMLTNAKNQAKSADPTKAAEAVSFLDHYNKLDRFSEEKSELLNVYKQKRTFNILTSVSRATTKAESSSVSGAKGYGTMCPY